MKERTPLRFKLGKLPAQPDKMKFSFTDYFSTPDLPKPPKIFGVWQHFWNLGMYNNDRVGCCVLAGAANETAAWNHDARSWVKFDDANVLADYTAITGYDPNAELVAEDPKQPDKLSNPTDTGIAMSDGAKYRRRTGIVDHTGKRHYVDAYVKLPRGDFDTLKTAMWLFGAVAIGIEVPDYFQDQWDDEVPWSVKKKYKIKGGHYVPGVGIDGDGHIVVISWSRYQRMTKEAYEKFSDEACAYLSVERIVNKLSPEGFNDEALRSDLKALQEPGGFSSDEGSWFEQVVHWGLDFEKVNLYDVMMNSFDVYQMYLALKSHFTSDYDYFKYQGKVRASPDTFRGPKDKYFFEKIAKHQDPLGFLLSNFLADPHSYVKEIAYGQEAKEAYTKWLKTKESLSYVFEDELSRLDRDFNANFLAGSNHPLVLRLYLGKKISLETLCILCDLTGCMGHWDRRLKDDIIYEVVSQTVKKYLPFIKYSKTKFKHIIKRKFERKEETPTT